MNTSNFLFYTILVMTSIICLIGDLIFPEQCATNTLIGFCVILLNGIYYNLGGKKKNGN